MSAIHSVLWPGMYALEPSSKLGGILARKRGYHNSRDHLPMPGYTTDYSINEFSVDREGPADEPAAIDWTFPDAQAGDYLTISKYSKRLMTAGKAGRMADPRTLYMREFFGNTDSDREVEGWDYAKNRASTSDSSHLWHIHVSIHRKYVTDPVAMQAILSILSAQPLDEWRRSQMRDLVFQHVDASLPVLKIGDVDGQYGNSKTGWVGRAQRLLGVPDDGHYGSVTKAAVLALGVPGMTGATIDLNVWERLYGLWGASERLATSK
jgi:hypothetical protein